MVKKRKIFFRFMAVISFIFITGCATNRAPTDPRDPYEHINRKIFAFNSAVDRAFFRPVAKVYDTVLPWQVKRSVYNIYNNVGDVTSAANELLQLDFPQAVSDLARVAINTILGFGGIFDVATHLGIERDVEDFGLTLAHWGSRNAPYIVLPFLGPSTIRDAVSLPVNYFFLNPWGYLHSPTWTYSTAALYFVETRASLLIGDKLVEQAFDPYVFVRDVYLQRREYLINENNEHRVEKYVGDHGVAHRRSQTLHPSRILSH